MSDYDPFLRPRFDFGNLPDSLPEDIQQHFADTCAIRCQEIILRDYGVELPEDFFVQEATSNGWYVPGGGTSLLDVGNLLELHGVPVQQYSNANIFNLVNELGQGHRVIVAVDADELWDQTSIFHDIAEIFQPSGSNHALIVSKIDVSDPNDVRVILTDPGTGDVAKEYSLEEFQDAWEDSNFFMVSTQVPPPASMSLPEMFGFDYDMGHIPEVFHMPWDQFQFACDQYDLMDLIPGSSEFEAFFDLMDQGSMNWPLYDVVLEDYDSFGLMKNDSGLNLPEEGTPEDPWDDSFPDPDTMASDDLSDDFIDPFNS